MKFTRRDFLNGVAIGSVAGSTLAPFEILAAQNSAPYPPQLTGLRGSHVGSFEVAHAVSWAGASYPDPPALTDAEYDLVVVGGGISGLSAAHFFRQKAGNDARILVLDNHDDFGGHAKRNEFKVGGHELIGYGGSQSIDTPGQYSAVARQLLVDLGIDTARFYDYFDREYFARAGLGSGMYFSEEGYGRDVTLPAIDSLEFTQGQAGEDPLAEYPLSKRDRDSLSGLLNVRQDPLPALDRDEKIRYLRSVSYRDFLLHDAGVTEEVYLLYRDTARGLWGIGWDALSALEAYRSGMPGTQQLGIGALEGEGSGHDEPYIFHFPDGNASIARLLVRKLVPDAVPGSTMEDIVLAKVDYTQLDQPDSRCRVRLNSTAVNVRHGKGGKHVDVTYVREGKVHRVRGKHAVLACYNDIIPHICAELPQEQADAIAYATKVPLVYVSVAIRNWQAFAQLGFSRISIPKPELMHSFTLDFPVSMGGYAFTDDPSQPTVVHGTYVPTVPDRGLTAREQHRLGRRRLYEMSFDDFEQAILRQMQGALSAGGFDAQRDIAALTVNRWPHGYAYEYNDLSDPAEYGPSRGPHIAGAAPLGRISIANSDASAYAYVNGAIDAAYRAVNEQLG
tara:strand:+ start:4929 stop:6785 length:1857 start_codon:yes stop_codon:yes gene_type:complete